MESKRRKFFKNQCKQLSKTDASQKPRKKESNAPEPLDKPRRSNRRHQNPSNMEVTVLGSPSYHNQNRSYSSITNEKKENEDNHLGQMDECNNENKIDNIQEEKQLEKDTTLQSNITDKVTDLIKEGDVTIKDYYDSIVRIELELEEDVAENSRKIPIEDENLINKTDITYTKENTTEDLEEYLQSKTDNQQVGDPEKETATDQQYNSNPEITEKNQHINEMENREVHPQLPTVTKFSPIIEKNGDQILNASKTINQSEVIQKTNVICNMINESVTINLPVEIENTINAENQENGGEYANTDSINLEVEALCRDQNIMETNLNAGENVGVRQQQPYPTPVSVPSNEINMFSNYLKENNNTDKGNSFSSEDIAKQTKKSKRKINKSYVDFISEDEDFFWDSTSWKETGDDTSASDQDKPKKKKKKKGTVDGKVGEEGLKKKKINKKKMRKELKSKGESYVKKDGIIVKEKELQPNPCTRKSCCHKCDEVSEDQRKALFTYFWNLPSQRKKDWLVAMSSKKDVQRKRSKDSNYRQRTFNYFINDGEGRRQVCQKFIINTLNITQRYIYYTLTTSTQGVSKEDARGKTIPHNKTSDVVKDSAKDFIKALPALPSHYCRKDSTRLYLPTEYKNLKNLYRIYKQERISKGIDVVNENLFRDIFNKEFNIGFHVPKKDKCLKCLKFEGQDPKSIPELKEHLAEKEASKTRLDCHREIGKENPSILCTSFDLQKVLNTPHGNSMLLFYSRKYSVFNLCFYESVTRNGLCYIWGESEGKRGGNEIATILQKYVESVDSRGSIKSLILYSDCCPGQNRNKIVLAALHNALLQSNNIETLQMNYLLPGHTEMTVDSIHSTIESSVRNTIVWAPSQWITICQLARKEPRPYTVEALTHHDFKSFDELSDKYFKGNLTGKINKIRTATFKKSSPSTMKIKFSMQKHAPEEKIAILAKPKAINRRYKSTLPITKSKYNDLKKLCDNGTIPRIFHSEYLNFPTYNGRDELLDTDVEDDTEEKE